MFADRIENLKLYIPYNEKIKVVCDYLAKTDIHALEVASTTSPTASVSSSMPSRPRPVRRLAGRRTESILTCSI